MIISDRHYATRELWRFFGYDHIKDDQMREVSARCQWVASEMIQSLPDSPQLTTGLRKLLEAKDCFVRAGMPQEPGPVPVPEHAP